MRTSIPSIDACDIIRSLIGTITVLIGNEHEKYQDSLVFLFQSVAVLIHRLDPPDATSTLNWFLDFELRIRDDAICILANTGLFCCVNSTLKLFVNIASQSKFTFEFEFDADITIRLIDFVSRFVETGD
jgi:hypothetical protein